MHNLTNKITIKIQFKNVEGLMRAIARCWRCV